MEKAKKKEEKNKKNGPKRMCSGILTISFRSGYRFEQMALSIYVDARVVAPVVIWRRTKHNIKIEMRKNQK